MTVQVDLRDTQLIATVYSFLVTVQVHYKSALSMFVHENGIPMGIPWKMSHGMEWDNTHCISHGTYGTEIDEQEIENLLNKHIDSKYECLSDNEL